MDIIWVAFGICVVVGFVFYVLTQYWQRLLTRHSRAIRDLTERVQALEAIEDPEFRRKLGDSAPSPLEQVSTFSLRLSERFWENALEATREEIAYVKANGKFLGSVKIERWRSHSVVTVYEILPQSKSAEWASRSIDVYSANGSGGSEPVTLWELPLAAHADYSPAAAPSVELRLKENGIELRAVHGRFGSGQSNGGEARAEECVFFCLPLDPARLAMYRKANASTKDDAEVQVGSTERENTWIAYFADQNEKRGIEWELCIRDLGRKEQWDRWRILEPWEVR